VEAPQPTGLASSITLRPYQKQSLAFMLSVENSTDESLVGLQPSEPINRHKARSMPMNRKELKAGIRKVDKEYGPAPPTRPVRGGWLCDEVGMGKTAIVTSLVLAAKSNAQPVTDVAFKKAMAGDGSGGSLADYPISLVITNNTLVQQWHGKQPSQATRPDSTDCTATPSQTK
jgi:hypothetical protein